MTPNSYTYTMKVQRRELIDLMVACTMLSEGDDKWRTLHDKLQEQLVEQDTKRGVI